MAKPIIFVDIDGPLLPNKQWYSHVNMGVMNQSKNNLRNILSNFDLKRQIRFDPAAVWMINMLAKYSDAEIVLSTSWVGHTKLDELKTIFDDNGLQVNFHKEQPITPKKFSSQRLHEIDWWLEDNPDVTDFVILDDDYSVEPHHLTSISGLDGVTPFAYMADHVVFINFEYGMIEKDFKKACSILGLNSQKILEQELK